MSVESSLQSIASEYLSTSRHGCEDVNHHSTQLDSVYNALISLLEQHPNLMDILHSDCQVVPPLTSLEDVPHMENIGDSAEECLKLIPRVSSEAQAHWDIIKIFLEKVQIQAQSANARDIGSDDTSTDDRPLDEQDLKKYLDRFDECLADVKMRQEEIEQNVIKAETAAANAQKAADGAVVQACDVNNKVVVAKRAVNRSIKAANTAATTAKSAKRIADKAEKTADNMIPNMLTVLGIFVGVIVAVVACYLTILLTENNSETISAVSIPLGFMFAWMMGHILVMAVFLLLYLTSKLTDRTLACHCRYYEANQQQTQQPNGQNHESNDKKRMPECIECKKNCRSLIRLKCRFPYLFWINIAFVVGYVILGVVHIIDLYYAKHLNYIIQLNWITLTLFAAIILTVILIATTVITKKISKASPKQNQRPT